jgi:hypothetical protein
MLDFDLAELYGVATKVLNQAVKRNLDRFPKNYMFRLTVKEWKILQLQMTGAALNNWSQIVTSLQKHRRKKTTPLAFTEHGVTMVASILRGKRATKMSIAIVNAFISMKQIVLERKDLSTQLQQLRQQLYDRIGEHDVQLTAIYDAIEDLLDEKVLTKGWQERERIGFKK